MPHVSQQNQVSRRGQMNRSDIDKEMRPAKPRDNLNTAFAGDQNHQAQSGKRTHLKSRRLRNSDKEPVR